MITITTTKSHNAVKNELKALKSANVVNLDRWVETRNLNADLSKRLESALHNLHCEQERASDMSATISLLQREIKTYQGIESQNQMLTSNYDALKEDFTKYKATCEKQAENISTFKATISDLEFKNESYADELNKLRNVMKDMMSSIKSTLKL